MLALVRLFRGDLVLVQHEQLPNKEQGSENFFLEESEPYPSTECLEWIHVLLIQIPVFTQIIQLGSARGLRTRKCCCFWSASYRWPSSHRAFISITLHVANLFIKFEIICLETFDFRPELRYNFKLFSQFLQSNKRCSLR